jgi:hypothetical protein
MKRCPRCDCRNGPHRKTCGKCDWDLSRPYSMEIELAMMEERDPKLKATAIKLAQAAKNLGIPEDA